MNVNEVIANIANEMLGEKKRGTKKPVHPNDHVNRGQSTNDSFPTAMHIALVLAIHKLLLPSLKLLRESLTAKAVEFESIVKVGRTHLQDATPITLGQEFSSYAYQIQMSEERLKDALKRLYPLAQGGTAVGTGLNTVEGFDEDFVRIVRNITGQPFVVLPIKVLCIVLCTVLCIVLCLLVCALQHRIYRGDPGSASRSPGPAFELPRRRESSRKISSALVLNINHTPFHTPFHTRLK
jgi:fumarate hydratase class II